MRTLPVLGDLQLEATFLPKGNTAIDLVDDLRGRIHVVESRVEVEGVKPTEVRLYDVSGRRWPIGKPVPTGVYMVIVGHHTVKIAVVRTEN